MLAATLAYLWLWQVSAGSLCISRSCWLTRVASVGGTTYGDPNLAISTGSGGGSISLNGGGGGGVVRIESVRVGRNSLRLS